MEVFSLILAALSVTTAQRVHLNPVFGNPGFRNAQTPLLTSASNNRPFISIPIVLLPDGQAVPKPRHTTYHYVGHATQNAPRQQRQRNSKQRDSSASKSTTSYQVIMPPSQQKKNPKPPKISAQQLNGQLRNLQPNNPRVRGESQQNHAQKGVQQQFEQNQQGHQVQFQIKQQKNPMYQPPSTMPSQQFIAAHKQNVANFVNFAANLGSTAVSQQQNQHQQVVQQTQMPASVATFQNNQHQKESYTNQRPLITNHKLNSGMTFQHQVPILPNTQIKFGQMLQSNVANHNNGHVSHQQQHSQIQPQQPQIQSSYPHQQHQQIATSQMQQVDSHSQQQLANSQHQQQMRTTQAQQPKQLSSTPASYASATSIRSNVQQSQGSELSNSVPNQAAPSSSIQQSSSSTLRSQVNPNSIVLVSNYNGQLQQNNQQNYMVSNQQQTVAAPQSVNTYNTQSQQPKSTLTSQQQANTASNNQNVQTSYITQNQGEQRNYNLNTQDQQITLQSTGVQSNPGFPLDQIAEINTFTLQNAHSNNGQIRSPLSYFRYHTAQDLPLTYASLINQGQLGYIQPSQNTPQADSSLDQPYSIVPNEQSVFSNSGQSIYTNQQYDTPTSSSSSNSEIATYNSYTNDQPVYSSSVASQDGYVATDKNYQGSQYDFLLQNSADTQSNQPSESQNSQSGSSTPLIYASSSPKQINYTPLSSSVSTTSQQYGYQSTSPTYVSFTTASGNLKSNPPAGLNYGQRASVIVTPGSTYTKITSNDNKQSEESPVTSDSDDDTEYEDDDEEDEDEEEASYKVVYIPLDILKNILSNSVENQ